jgi:hypothetical protein
MVRRIVFLWLLFLVAATVGCGPSAQEQYDDAVADLERAEARLDNLRPAYDEARKQAELIVCKEIAGTTPDESAMAALSQLSGAMDQTLSDQLAGQPSAANTGGGGRPTSDADAAIDQLLSAHSALQEQQAAATAPIAKVHDTMARIKTPGTAEAKRVDEVLAKMPQAAAYQRQEQRVERAKQAVDEASARLPAASGAAEK